ncbi:hypothetical protein FWF48_03700 [Candidatus Saccharibacteria bacterium]|nr:hypothetical protein [Candidatus Saccharibacteria bacterium]
MNKKELLDFRYYDDAALEDEARIESIRRRKAESAERKKRLQHNRVMAFIGGAALAATIGIGSKAMATSSKHPETNHTPAAAAPAPESALLQTDSLQDNEVQVKDTEPESDEEPAKTVPEKSTKTKPETADAKSEQSSNVFDFEPQVWQGIKKAAKSHDLSVEFVTSIVNQESHGDTQAESQDGFSSFGLMQPSLVYHFSEFAPALKKANVLSVLTSKSANEITPDDNTALLASFEQLNKTQRAKVTNVLCDIGTNLDVGCAYLKGEVAKVKQEYPNLSRDKQFELAAMAYNGGSSVVDEYMNGVKSPRVDNVEQYWQFVNSYYGQAKAGK